MEFVQGETLENLIKRSDRLDVKLALEIARQVPTITGAMLRMPYFLALKAEALYFADRVSEALEAITEAEEAVERSGERWWCAELHRLRGVFLTAMGADETQIEASFCAAISTAKEQKSISLEKRAEGTYADIAGKKQARQEDVDSDYLFANFFQLIGFRSRVSVGAPQGLMSSPSFAGFLVSGQPSAGRELGDPIDREVSQFRQGRAKVVANRDF